MESITVSYRIHPVQVNEAAKYSMNKSIWGSNLDFIMIAIVVEIIAIIVAIYSGGGSFWVLGLVVIVGYFIFNKVANDNDDEKLTRDTIANQKRIANEEAEFYTGKLNSILAKSAEILNYILPYCEASAKQHIDKAKIEFSENVYSPFWSEIEEATKFLACYKEAVNQLCMNSEIYACTLENKRHNFPVPFPFATDISISKIVIDEYKITIRQAQKNETFSIIWEQRRNTQILIGGFRTLENAINNMNDNIFSAISDLKNSIISELSEMKYVQKEQLKSFETSQVYLSQTLDSMDTKLYYIQWKKRPPGTFHYK